MKKDLQKLLSVMLLTGASFTASAQLALVNFNSGLPSTWSTIKVDNNTVSTSLVAEIQTGLATKGWMTRIRATGDSCMLTASAFTPVGKADRWLVSQSFTVNGALAVLKWEDWEGVGGVSDSIQVWVSPTAGTTVASFTTKIYDGPVGAYAAGVFVTHGASLSAYNGQTIRVAFRNNSYNQGTSRLDNVQTELKASAIDGSVDSVAFPGIVASTSSNQVKVFVGNQGANTITSLNLSYKVDAGTAVTQNFTGLSIPPYGTTMLTFTTPIANPTVGGHTITASITQVNGAADPVTTNNQRTANFAVGTQSVQRVGLIEEFTSSTCVPCAAFNLNFDPMLVASGANSPSSNFAVIKYQMNWPSPGTDFSYNTEGNVRRGYYGVNAIPDHFTNGKPGAAGDQAEVTASKADPAYMNISGSYTVKSDSLIVSVTVTPYFTLTGANHKVHIIGTQRNYAAAAPNFGTTTTQSQYYFVERLTFPSGGNGITVSSWTAGVPQTFTYRTKATVGSVAQMNNNFYTSPFMGDLVVFVQDNGSKDVLQAKAIPASWPTSVNEVSELSNAILYPNPASDEAMLLFNMPSSTTADVSVTDLTGRVVYAVADQKLPAGNGTIRLPLTNMTNGLYNVTVVSPKGTITKQLSVIK